MKKVIISIAFLLVVVGVGAFLLKPVEFALDGAEVDSLHIAAVADNSTKEIVDRETIERLVTALNCTEYRKAVIPENEAPDNLIAVVALVCGNSSLADIVVKGSDQQSFQFYVNHDGKQLVPFDGTEVTEILSTIVFEITEGIIGEVLYADGWIDDSSEPAAVATWSSASVILTSVDNPDGSITIYEYHDQVLAEYHTTVPGSGKVVSVYYDAEGNTTTKTKFTNQGALDNG